MHASEPALKDRLSYAASFCLSVGMTTYGYFGCIFIPTCAKNRVLRMDFGAGCRQLWICSAEPPGE